MGEPLREGLPAPEFATEEEAREFWSTHDSAPYFETMEDVTASPPSELRQGPGRERSSARKRPAAGSMELVSICMPVDTIAAIKAIAARRNLPYQTLMRSWVGERLAQESAPQPEAATSDVLVQVWEAQQQQTALLHTILDRVSRAGERTERSDGGEGAPGDAKRLPANALPNQERELPR